MSVHRTHNEISFECEDCGALLETYEQKWEAAMLVFRNESWRAHKNGNEWEHYCSECKGTAILR